MPARPDAQSRRGNLAALGIVGLAALLRGWGLGAGAPFRMSVDEPAVLGTALAMLRSGDFNPHFFDYGGLIFYFHLGVAVLGFLTGAMSGRWQSLEQLWVGDLLVYARVATALLAIATVLLVWLAGRRWGIGVGLLAAFSLAIQPQHVRESHFALTDVPLTFLIALTLLLSLRAAENGRLRTFAAAGIAAGAAAAIKYNGILALAMPVAAAIASPAAAAAVGSAVAVSIAAAMAGYFAGAPYTVLDLPNFLNGLASLIQHYNDPQSRLEVTVTYLKYVRNWFSWPGVLRAELGWLALGVCGVGLVAVLAGVRNRSTRAAALAVVIFPAAYFWLVVTQGALQFGRYLLPILPMLSIVLGVGITVLWNRLRQRPALQRRAGAAILLALIFAPPLLTSISFDVAHARQATAEQASRWILDNLTPQDRIVIEMEAARLPPRYQVENVRRLTDRSMDDYRAEGKTYLVASSGAADRYHLGDPARRAQDLSALSTLLRSGQVVVTFPASREHPGDTVTVIKVPR